MSLREGVVEAAASAAELGARVFTQGGHMGAAARTKGTVGRKSGIFLGVLVIGSASPASFVPVGFMRCFRNSSPPGHVYIQYLSFFFSI